MVRNLCGMALLLVSSVVFADTPLAIAAKNGSLDEVRQLVAAGAKVNAVDPEDVWERTALMQAARMGHTSVVEFLLSEGADVKQQGDGTGASPLREAAYKGHLGVVNALLAAGAAPDVDADANGRTPLLWALIGKQPDAPAIVEALLKAGANSQQVFEGFDGAKVPAAQLAEKAGPEVEAAFRKNAGI
ncbi:ankyrin repeat domain-containing protein [Pseudomonas sp. PDM16]|uniref:ankyrin repeat domain-containing protein n=1 Tax=Pseudomonas sp. PDM16 TaxID=2769292 RepID=UPI00399A7993